MQRALAPKKLVALMGAAALAATLVVPTAGAGVKRWTRHGPFGGWGLSVAVHPDNAQVALAGSNGGGLYRTTDGGKNWAPVAGVPATAQATDIAWSTKNPSIVYAAVSNFDVYKSTDAGKSWEATGRSTALSVAVDPTNPQIVYSGGYSGSLKKSTNGGQDWVDKNTGISNAHVDVVLVDPKIPTTVWAGTDDTIYRNEGGGDGPWTQRATGLPASASVRDLAIDHEDSDILWAAMGNEQLWRTDDEGAQWDQVTAYTSPFANSVEVDPTNSARVYVGSSARVYLLTNNGQTIAERDFDFFQLSSIAVSLSNSPILYAVDLNSIFRSIDRGQQWLRRDKGYIATDVYDMDIAGTSIFAATGQKGIVRSTDGGTTWTSRNNGLSDFDMGAIAVAPSARQIMYAGMGTDTDAVFRSEDSGASWARADDGMVDGATELRIVSALEVHPDDPNVVLAGGSQNNMSIFKTTDGGDNWAEKPTGLSVALTEVHDIVFHPVTPSTVYAATDVGLYRSTTLGESWGVLGPPGNPEVHAVAIDPEAPQTLYAATGDGVWKSINGGNTWDALPKGLDNHFLRDVIVDPTNPNIVYAAGRYSLENSGMFKTVNGGVTWSPMDRGYSGTTVDNLLLDRSKGKVLHAGTWSKGVESYLIHPFVKGFPRFSKSQKIIVAWGGPAGHSIKHYDVDVRKGAYDKELGARSLLANNARAGKRVLEGKPGFTYCYRSRANDSKRSSDFSQERCAAIPLDDRSFAQQSNADWAEKTGTGYYRNTYLEGKKQGKKLTLGTLKGTDFGLMVSKCPECGVIQVTFDTGLGGGSVGNYDLSGAGRKKIYLDLANFSAPVTASVTVEIISAGKPVRIDGLAVRKEIG